MSVVVRVAVVVKRRSNSHVIAALGVVERIESAVGDTVSVVAKRRGPYFIVDEARMNSGLHFLNFV